MKIHSEQKIICYEYENEGQFIIHKKQMLNEGYRIEKIKTKTNGEEKNYSQKRLVWYSIYTMI
jgi:hypothetical protein